MDISRVRSRIGDVLKKLDRYLAKSKLNSEEREDFRDLQRELEDLKRFKDVCDKVEE